MYCLNRVYLGRGYLKDSFPGGVIPRGAYLGGANLERVNLRGANLDGVQDFALMESDSVGSTWEVLSSRVCVREGCTLKRSNLVWSVWKDSTLKGFTSRGFTL